MKIAFVPIDNRPVCYSLVKDISAIDESIELILPPREMLGSLTKISDIKGLFIWLKNLPECDAIILSLDTLAYGGLISSRRCNNTFTEIESRLENLKAVLQSKNTKIYAFSSIMRISNNNFNEEEKEYWSKYGKKIFEYSYNLHRYETADSSDIPDDILNDYFETRKRNFEINKIYLKWQKEGFFDTLIFSKDDCAVYGLNVKEALELEKLGGFTKTGADEIPLALFSRSINKNINIFVEYTEPDCKNLISNYEDISVEKSVTGQLELGKFNIVNSENEADVVLIVNNFRERQGEHVMGWDTPAFNKNLSVPQNKLYAAADIRYANGADNAFVEELFKKINKNFIGYAGWNTSANTLGSLLAEIKVKFNAEKYNKKAFEKLQMIRFLDDWAYQANVRKEIKEPTDIKDRMESYAKRLSKFLDYEIDFSSISYTYPWKRKFEIEVII